MKQRRTICSGGLNRGQIKSSEGEFIWELENSHELSPKLIEQIILTAKEILFWEYQTNYPADWTEKKMLLMK